MKKMLSKLAVLLVVALVMGLGVALPAMADPLPMETVVRKNLAMPEHVVVPVGGLEFAFNFARVGNVPPAPALNIPNQTISFTAGSAIPPAGGVLTDTLDLITILNGFRATPGLNAGYQDWIVTEVNTDQSGVTYDLTQFRLRVHFANCTDAANPYPLRIASVETFRTVNADGTTNAAPGVKVPGIVYNNRFAPQDIGNDTDPTRPALVVTKEITGYRPYADLSTSFNFTMTLNAPTFNPPIPNATPTLGEPLDIIEAEIVDAAGTVIGTVNFIVGAGGLTATPALIPAAPPVPAHHFQLRDGETLRFLELPGGTTYTVTEIATANFAGQVTIYVAGNVTSVVPPTNPPVNADVTGSGAVSNVTAGDPPVLQRNAADFTNAYHRTPPTGLVIANMPFFAAGFAALALALMLTSRSRKRIEEMPIAY